MEPECPRSDEEDETRETPGQKKKTALKGKETRLRRRTRASVLPLVGLPLAALAAIGYQLGRVPS
jgi:hypothetical protein